MVQLVIPAAGRGSRFNGSEFIQPKPLISWDGKNMIQHVVSNFEDDNLKITLIKREHHDVSFDNVEIINIDYTTDGPASTAALAKKYLDLEGELIITNCDQIIKDWDLNRFLSYSRNYDGVFGCFISTKPHNSYVQLDYNNLVVNVREKEVISNLATNGLHYWKKAKYFFEAYEKMKSNNDTTNGEYFIAPSYNYLIKEGYKIGIFMFNEHFPIGTPDDLKNYLEYENN